MFTLPTQLDELKPWPNWVVARLPNKAPLNPNNGSPASSTNPQTWGSYETALACCNADPSLVLGFMFSKTDGFVGIDCDDPNGDAEAIEAQRAIFNQIQSYAETSQSGKGLHIICKGELPTAGRKSPKHKIEMYQSERYFIVTGNMYRDLPVNYCNGSLTHAYNRLFPNEPAQQSTVESQPQTQSDDAVLTMAANAANGELFKELLAGKWQGKYKSQSEADFSFIDIVAFYSDSMEQVKRIFLASALGERIRTGAKRKHADYIKNMVNKSWDFKQPLAFDPHKFTVTSRIDNVPLPIQAPVARKVEIITVANIETEIINWMWESYLPFKKLALLAGKSAAGKSTLTLEFAAVVSRGGEWPDKSRCAHAGHVLIWTAEDGAADTVRPRLLAANADVNKVHIITAINDSIHGKLPFNPATDIPLLKEVVTLNNDISLVIVDPIISAVDGDMNQPNVVRKSLQALVDFAAEVNCCVLGITHFKKSSEGQDPVERIIGSQAFHALPRVILVAGKDENTDRRVLAIAKGSVGKDSSGFEYSIEGTVVESLVKTSHIVWGEAIQGSARDILASVEGENSKESSPHGNKLENAKQFLETFLANGAAYTKDELNKNAKLLGISANTLTRAKDELLIGHETTA